MGNSTKFKKERPGLLKFLLACGAIGPILFIIVFLIEGATRAGYDPLRHPVSSLSIGATGWTQAANFILTGLLVLAFAIGLHHALQTPIHTTLGPLLLELVGMGLIGAGIFTTDPVYGYPTDQPLVLAQYTLHGHLHDLVSLVVFVCLPAACFVFCRRFFRLSERGWAVYSLLSGLGIIAAFVLASLGFDQTAGFVAFGGLFQRLSISIGWIWISLLAVHALKTPGQDLILTGK